MEKPHAATDADEGEGEGEALRLSAESKISKDSGPIQNLGCEEDDVGPAIVTRDPPGLAASGEGRDAAEPRAVAPAERIDRRELPNLASSDDDTDVDPTRVAKNAPQHEAEPINRGADQLPSLASDDTDADPTRVAKNAPRVEAKRSDPGTAEIPSLASDTDDFDPTKVAKNPPAFRAEEPQTFKLRLRDHLAARLAERPRAAAKAAVPASAAVAREPSAVDVASGIPRVVRRDPKAPVVDKAAIIPARRAPRREAIVPFTERATIPAENERRGVGVDVSEPERVGVVVRGPALAERLQQGEPRVSGPPLHRSPQALEHPIPSMPPAPGLGASPSPRAAVPPRRVPAAPPATRTLVLVALVSVVCLAIFVTGLVLFITEP